MLQLILLFLLAAARTEAWIILDGVDSAHATEIMTHFDCRAYHGGLALLGEDQQTAMRLRSLNVSNVQLVIVSSSVTSLQVIQFSAECKHSLPFAPLYTQSKIHDGSNFLRAVSEVDELPSDFVKACRASSVSVATDSMVPQRVTTFPEAGNAAHARIYDVAAGAKDPRIEAMVASVRGDRQRDIVNHLSSYHTRQSQSTGAAAAEKWLSDQLSALGYSVTIDPFRNDMSANVVADLPGRVDPSQIIIVGAHYDSRATDVNSPTQRAPGADDNASGTAMLLEIARIIAGYKEGFAHTVRLIAFGGEEQGLLGSRDYAKRAAADGVNVVAMFNGDMFGWSLPGQPRKLGMKDKSVSEWLLEEVNKLTEKYTAIPVGLSPSCCSDYLSFHENGFPAVGYFENVKSASDNPNYHKESDTPNTLDYVNVQLGTQAVLAATATFAVPQ